MPIICVYVDNEMRGYSGKILNVPPHAHYSHALVVCQLRQLSDINQLITYIKAMESLPFQNL